MWPRMFMSFSWADRASGAMRYKLGKGWVPKPGAPTSSKTVAEGVVLVPTHTEERELFAAVLRAVADELGGPL